jgi:surface antigen
MNRSTANAMRPTMPDTLRCRLLIVFAAILLLVAGCGKHTKPPQQAPEPATAQQHSVAPVEEASPAEQEEGDRPGSCRDEQAIRASEHGRAACFHLQPGATTTRVVKHQVPAKSAKGAHAVKKGAKTAAKTHTTTETKVVHTGRCQPQCVIYARCRTGFATCRLGDTGPVQWFACAAKNGATSSHPHVGSVMVFAAHSGHGMPTGHVAYVEAAKKHGNGTWQLRISHTNYDRKCHLDQDAMILFDPKQMTVTVETGPWAPWGKHLKILGFILR